METLQRARATRERLAAELMSEVLRLSGTAQMRVLGSSMLPAILPGDILVLEKRESVPYLVGEVIVFAKGDRLFAHRVAASVEEPDGRRYLTRGDSLAHVDPPVSPEEVLGRAACVLRNGRRLDPRTTLSSRAASMVLRNSDLLKACVLWVLNRTRAMGEAQCPA